MSCFRTINSLLLYNWGLTHFESIFINDSSVSRNRYICTKEKNLWNHHKHVKGKANIAWMTKKKITLEGLKSPTHNNFETSKVEFGSFWPKTFSVFGPFQAVVLRNRLDITRITTTGSGRIYAVGRIILVCNPYAVTIFWLYFLVFGLFQPLYRPQIARCAF